jgi:hypothetical protein
MRPQDIRNSGSAPRLVFWGLRCQH